MIFDDAPIDTINDVELIGTAELAHVAGITYRQLDYWLRRGYLPVGSSTPGTGKRRRFVLDEIVRIRVAAELVRLGMAPIVAGQYAASLTWEWTGEPVVAWAVTLDGGAVLTGELTT